MSQIDHIQTAASRLLNTLLGGRSDQMLSSRAYERSLVSKRWEWVRAGLDAVFFWQPEHCRKSYVWELSRDC